MATKRCPYCAEEIQPEAIKCKHCGTWLAPPPDRAGFSPPPSDPGPGPSAWTPSRRLARASFDRMLAGVCGGLAQYVGIDPTLMRVLYAAATVFTALIPGVILYIALAFIMPPEADARP